MFKDITDFQKHLKESPFAFKNKKLVESIKEFNFILISENENLPYYFEKNQLINQNLRNSKVIIIYKSDLLNETSKDQFIIICFEKTLIILKQSIISSLYTILSNNSNISICFLKNTKEIFTEQITNPLIEYNANFEEEIVSINMELQFIKKMNSFNFWSFTSPCISGYLIKKSYFKINYDRIQSFNDFLSNPYSLGTVKQQDFIELRDLGFGSLFKVKLIYHIERGELFALKKQNIIDNEIHELMRREKSNYEKIHHPYIPKFFGTVKDCDSEYVIIEFINGQTLDKCQFDLYDENDITMLIFQLLLIVVYFHHKDLLIRDLKPKNLMITENKDIVMIDFDRVIIKSTQTYSHDLYNEFAAPEVNESELYSEKSDVYSFGKVIELIIEKWNSKIVISEINDIKNQCLQKTSDQRPTINKIIDNFLNKFQNVLLNKNKSFITKLISNISFFASNQNNQNAQSILGFIYLTEKYVERDINKAIYYFSLASNQNYANAQFYLGLIYSSRKYVERDINKAIYYYSLASNQNHPQAQFNLGFIYEKGKYVERDINKAIYYYSLASNQNDAEAQYRLGIIYSTGEYIKRDINKAIYYFSLASNQNHSQAQLNLGFIYSTREYIKRDINKVIYYFSLASNQNIPEAQFSLGYIYITGEYVEQDINKAIYYFSLASNQNFIRAQFNLGVIYSSGKYVERDINKAIYYFSLASNQNDAKSQYNLGVIYSTGEYVERDINKAIYYYSLASNQNHPEAQYRLGFIYSTGEYIKLDINKAIYYYSLASNQNDAYAQSNLGFIYEEGKYVERDINKAIHYYSLASNQNHPEAQFNLGVIYFKGEYIERDINKAIYYFSLASNQNHSKAQFYLGVIYYSGYYCKRDIKKGQQYIILSSYYNFRLGNFCHGFLLHKEKKIVEAIHYYKEASSFNIQFAKNNLGIIYKNGFGGEIQKRIGDSIEYFEEAIRQKNDFLSMYNLAHIHIYDESIKQYIDKSIELLIKSSTKFEHSLNLLCVVLIKTLGFNIERIKHEIDKRVEKSNELYSKILIKVNLLIYSGEPTVNYLYETYRNKDFLYDVLFNCICSSDLLKENTEQKKKNPHLKDISEDFYKGISSF